MKEMVELVVSLLPLFLFVGAIWFGLRRHARVVAESNARTMELLVEQTGRQTAELKRIADALEHRGQN